MKRKNHDPSGASGREKGIDSGLTLKKRPLVDLDEDQMADIAGGHPHTCEPTCPQTCCPTCPNTCDGNNTCHASCGGTCGYTCNGTCPGDDTCDAAGCVPTL